MTEAEKQIRKAHEEAMVRLTRVRETMEAMREQERLTYLCIKDCEAAGRLFGIEFPSVEYSAKPRPSVENVREFAIEYLKNSSNGAKSSDMTAAYKEAFGRELHPKTIGMTLYRLKNDGVASRDGHVWHFS